MKVLITGGTGLVGSAINNSITQNENEFVFLSSKHCDLRDHVACEKLFSEGNFDIVIHLANKVGGLYKNLDNNYSILIDNITMNTNILECCRKYNIKRLINCLSTCIFGNNLVYPLTSDQMYDKKPDDSNEGYSISKRYLNSGSKLLSRCSDIEIVNLIPTNIYGLNDNFHLHDAHVIPNLICKTYLAKRKLQVHDNMESCLIIKGAGKARRQFIFANDFAKIILYFLNCELSSRFNRLIIGPPEEDEISIKELVNKITTIFNFKGRIIYDVDYSEGQHKKTVSNKELLEYLPDFKFIPLEIGLEKTIKYFIENYSTVRK
jgi:GDP-L-fucose synthase